MTASRSTFKLRFRSEKNYELLQRIAERSGVSMNQLAEDLIARELRTMALGMEIDLADTLRLLRKYRDPGIEKQAADFARAEVEYDDPLRAEHVETEGDPHGVAAAFGYSMER